MLGISIREKSHVDDIRLKNILIFITFILSLSFVFSYWYLNQPDDPFTLSFTMINETRLDNGTWIQEVYTENGVLYSVACIKDKEPRLYKHSSPTNRTYIKRLCEAPDGFIFHKGLAITRADSLTYAFVNVHVFEKTLTACYSGETIEDLEYIGIISQAGYFLNTTVNFRIRDVWFNETDQLFYAYFDGSDTWKGTHYYTFLGRSPDFFFSPQEFEYLYCAGNGWNKGGLYAPNVLWLDEYGIGCVKGHKNLVKPYDFDSDLVFLDKPSRIQFLSNLWDTDAYFSKFLNDETQASFFFMYDDNLYLASRHGEYQTTPVYGTIYEVEIN